ncbi:unnamed protein product [Arctia plantaginis]|uniref:Fanconi-associated nuclease n=1 Tax=Arctia plantaginis TaxID=874455 RepID=A0A8S1BJL5_ARCPL|nr:unnamed protein product [Arctia plantaginis]
MKQMQIENYFTKKRKNIINESNHKKRCLSDQQRLGEDSSDLFCSSSDSSSNSGTIANEHFDRLFDNSRKSEEKEIDTLGQTDVYTDPESVIVCDVNPNIVNEIQSEPLQFKKKGDKKSLSPLKNRLGDGPLFIYDTIDQYDKHLKTSETFKGILTDESLALLSTLGEESEGNKQLMSYLFCVDQYAPEGITEIDFPTKKDKKQAIIFDYMSLYEGGFITFTNKDADKLPVDQCKTLLTKIMNTTHMKQKTKGEIMTNCLTRDIRECLNHDEKSKECSGISNDQVLKKLRSKVKKWKLTDLARETITELTVLMHLDSIFKMGFSIDFTRVKDFCAYLNALALVEKYKEAKDKGEFVLSVKNLYRDEENMSHHRALPLWLRKFTPIYIYLNILSNGVDYLKKSKEYDEALEILDLLIAQTAFHQDTKAQWYNKKVLLLYSLKSHEEAADTLYEAFNAGLPGETVMTLQRRAKEIARKTRSQIDQEVHNVLRVNGEREISEGSIPDPRYYYQEPVEKSNSKDKPKYKWNNELVSAETLCCNFYKETLLFTLVEHWEGDLINTIYFILFWDIIYTKPLAIGGIFLSHYQQYPLDMLCENFYINRKAIIDEFLTIIQNSTENQIMKMIKDWYDKFDINDMPVKRRKMVNYNNIEIVVRCLRPRALAAICRRLAQNYKYMRCGFPDLTLCNTEKYTIEFREVKTNEKVQDNQLQWLHYLNEHKIKAGFCYLINKKEQHIAHGAAYKYSIDSSYPPDTNNGYPQPGPSTSLTGLDLAM